MEKLFICVRFFWNIHAFAISQLNDQLEPIQNAATWRQQKHAERLYWLCKCFMGLHATYT